MTADEQLMDETEALLVAFTDAMRTKLAAKERQFGATWNRPEAVGDLRHALFEHMIKGDPLDLANYCAFLWHHRLATTPTDAIIHTIVGETVWWPIHTHNGDSTPVIVAVPSAQAKDGFLVGEAYFEEEDWWWAGTAPDRWATPGPISDTNDSPPTFFRPLPKPPTAKVPHGSAD